MVGLPVGWLVGEPVGWLVGLPVGWLVGLPVGWLVGALVGAPVGWLVGAPDVVAPGWATAAQYAVTLAAPPAAAARLRKATAFCLAVPCAFTCAYAVHRPKAAFPVACGPTGVAGALGCDAGAPMVSCASF